MSRRLDQSKGAAPVGAAAALALCAWLGCQDSSLAKVERERQQSIKRTLKTLDEQEARAVRSLLETQREVDRQARRDAAALRTDFSKLDHRIKAEFERWDKKKPQIEAEVQHRMRGNPERLRETATQFY